MRGQDNDISLFIDKDSDPFYTDLLDLCFKDLNKNDKDIKNFNQMCVNGINDIIRNYDIEPDFLSENVNKEYYKQIQQKIIRTKKSTKMEQLGLLLIKWRMIHRPYDKSNITQEQINETGQFKQQNFNFMSFMTYSGGKNNHANDETHLKQNYDFSILLTIFLFSETDEPNFTKYKSNHPLYQLFDKYPFVAFAEIKTCDRQLIRVKHENLKPDGNHDLIKNIDTHISTPDEEAYTSDNETKHRLVKRAIKRISYVPNNQPSSSMSEVEINKLLETVPIAGCDELADENKEMKSDNYLDIILDIRMKQIDIDDIEEQIEKTKTDIRSLVLDYKMISSSFISEMNKRRDWLEKQTKDDYVEMITYDYPSKLTEIKKQIYKDKEVLEKNKVKLEEYKSELEKYKSELERIRKEEIDKQNILIETFNSELEEIEKLLD